jgi:hypothetical protein
MSENLTQSLSNIALGLREHADRCAEAIRLADNRAEHIQATQLALEAARLALNLEQWISQNTQVGTGPVTVIALVPNP